MDKKDKNNTFTSAMDNLKGLLDKEGIKINSSKDNDSQDQDIPTLGTDAIEVSDITEAINNDIINDFEQRLKNNPVSDNNSDDISVDLPVLDGTITVTDEVPEATDLDDYIADMEDDDFDVMEFASSVEELEEQVGAITEPEHLQEFVEKHSEKANLQQLKNNLQQHLASEIDKAMDELKTKLLASLNHEIEQFFKK